MGLKTKVAEWRAQAASIMQIAKGGKLPEKAQTLLVCADELDAVIRESASAGGKASRRKLTKKQAREMVKARELKRAAGVAFPSQTPDEEKRPNEKLTDCSGRPRMSDTASIPVQCEATPQGGAEQFGAAPGSAIAGYKLPCPRCRPHWNVAVMSKRRGFDHREFFRGTCSQCGWRVVKMISPNESR